MKIALLSLMMACGGDKLACGPGTHEQDGLCLADSGPPAETGSADTDASGETGSAETGQPAETADSGETGESSSEIEVYILAGQSNMDGYGVYTGLPPDWRAGDPDVSLYWSGWGEFRPLAPASFGGSPYTGPEVSLGRALRAAGREVALVKHAVGGTDLYGYWYPGESAEETGTGEGWSTLLTTLAGAKAELDAAGRPWRWAGFVWMQGESDALYDSYAAVYQTNLERLLRRVREETDEPELPAVLGLIACEDLCPALYTVRDAQETVAERDPYTSTVETLDLQRTWYDPWHYDGVGVRVLGERFAQRILGEEPDANVKAALKVDTYVVEYDGDFTVGWAFSLDRPITITDVGGFAEPGSYLYTSAELGIWDESTGALVLRDTVPGWYEAPTSYRDGFWYTAIDPVTLDAGSYVVGLVSWGGDYDRYANDAVVEPGPGLTLTEAAYTSAYWLSYPGTRFETTARNLAFIGPSFLYTDD